MSEVHNDGRYLAAARCRHGWTCMFIRCMVGVGTKGEDWVWVHCDGTVFWAPRGYLRSVSSLPSLELLSPPSVINVTPRFNYSRVGSACLWCHDVWFILKEELDDMDSNRWQAFRWLCSCHARKDVLHLLSCVCLTVPLTGIITKEERTSKPFDRGNKTENKKWVVTHRRLRCFPSFVFRRSTAGEFGSLASQLLQFRRDNSTILFVRRTVPLTTSSMS
jgi:hypothetical protein